MYYNRKGLSVTSYKPQMFEYLAAILWVNRLGVTPFFPTWALVFPCFREFGYKRSRCFTAIENESVTY